MHLTWFNDLDGFGYDNNGFGQIIRFIPGIYKDINGCWYLYFNNHYKGLGHPGNFSGGGLRYETHSALVDVYGNVYFRDWSTQPNTIFFSEYSKAKPNYRLDKPMIREEWVNHKKTQQADHEKTQQADHEKQIEEIKNITRHTFLQNFIFVFGGLWLNSKVTSITMVPSYKLREIQSKKFGANERQIQVLGMRKIFFSTFDAESIICEALDNDVQGYLVEAVKLFASNRRVGTCEVMGFLKAVLDCDGLITALDDQSQTLDRSIAIDWLNELSFFEIRRNLLLKINHYENALKSCQDPDDGPQRAPKIRDELLNEIKAFDNEKNYQLL